MTPHVFVFDTLFVIYFLNVKICSRRVFCGRKKSSVFCRAFICLLLLNMSLGEEPLASQRRCGHRGPSGVSLPCRLCTDGDTAAESRATRGPPTQHIWVRVYCHLVDKSCFTGLQLKRLCCEFETTKLDSYWDHNKKQNPTSLSNRVFLMDVKFIVTSPTNSFYIDFYIRDLHWKASFTLRVMTAAKGLGGQTYT